jgi:hypothetical protein
MGYASHPILSSLDIFGEYFPRQPSFSNTHKDIFQFFCHSLFAVCPLTFDMGPTFHILSRTGISYVTGKLAAMDQYYAAAKEGGFMAEYKGEIGHR